MTHRRYIRLAGLLAVAALCARPAYGMDPSAVPPGSYVLDPQHTRIAWSVSHLGYSTYTGLIPFVHGTLLLDPSHPGATRLDAEIPMAGITSLDPALDARLHGGQFFAVDRYPSASYQAQGLVITAPGHARLDGLLTLCGVTHPVTMNVVFGGAGIDPVDGRLTVGFEASAIVRRSAFGVVAYVPVVGDDVTLILEAEVKPKPEQKMP
ncbi:YceI family protein [Lichenicoccus sp.]|uniref:YceI family protein n=1 Tax=Lichenicoccus sp. TaxID=2781899 RepID=UPI003D14E88E